MSKKSDIRKHYSRCIIPEPDLLADRICQRAFEINKARGVTPWPESRDWVQAEREIRAESAQPIKLSKM